ncbi:unnamed protein product [Rotaria sp. Silwood1]|nr:unnamed protein product [Rotaria sp. Silwood1]
MVVDRTLYNVLGVEPNATQEQISKAAKKKSLEHHPDRGGSHEKMQQVNAAREVLMDPKKRETYDRYGLEGMKTAMPNENFNFPGFPGSIFDLFNLFEHGNTSQGRSTINKGNDIKHVLKVSLEELYSGTTRTIFINCDFVCVECDGIGCHDGIPRECNSCQGTGIGRVIHRMGPMIQQIQQKCSTCNGEGYVIDSINRCRTCDGKKVIQQEKSLDINIAHGSQHRETIKLSGEGNQIPNGEAGTVYVILEQQPHATFDRKGDDLIINMQINLTESLCGFQRTITLLDGHNILINHPPGKPIVPNSYRSLKGYGMPNRNTHTNGDVIIRFDVKFPEDNFIQTESQYNQLEAILPPKMHNILKSNEHYEEVKMMPCDSFQENSHQNHFSNGHHHHNHGEEYEDDAHFNGHPEGVQCATQ